MVCDSEEIERLRISSVIEKLLANKKEDGAIVLDSEENEIFNLDQELRPLSTQEGIIKLGYGTPFKAVECKVHILCSKPKEFNVTCSRSTTLRELKIMFSKHCDIEQDLMQIKASHIELLNDLKSLGDYNIKT